MRTARKIFKLFYFLSSISFCLLPSLAFSQPDWFHCPFVEEIKKKGDSLEATTTTHGITIKWSGWMQSTNLPSQFVSVFFEGLQPPWFIICTYKDGAGNYGRLAPLYAEYKSPGETSGPWSERICYTQDPDICKFSVIRDPLRAGYPTI
jgi:hypothetical protein